MPTIFMDPSDYVFQPGALFLGLDESNREIGVTTERHAITIAGAGAGKGAALLIPNARRWPHNLLVVDPKGEVAENSWEYREKLGQHVGVLDPFKIANVPDRLRVTFNPLADIEPKGLTSREDLEVIADGMVKRSDPKHAEWDDGAVALLAGLMAFTVADAPPEHRNLGSVRKILQQPDDVLFQDAQRMIEIDAFGGLARAAGITLMTVLNSERSMEKDFLGGARRHSNWVNSEAIAPVLESSTFNLTGLKSGAASLFLVLPPNYLSTHGAFLRLFVRCVLNVMAKGGLKGRRCLFLLDEFHSLGKINEIAIAAGLMRGYGVSLWPFMQDIGQLMDLYGDKAAHTFFGNADAHVFFGNTDAPTLEYLSQRIGVVTQDQVGQAPNAPRTPTGLLEKIMSAPSYDPEKYPLMHKSIDQPRAKFAKNVSAVRGLLHSVQQVKYQNDMQAYQRETQQIGRPLIEPHKLAQLIEKRLDLVADKMVALVHGNRPLLLSLAPYSGRVPNPLISPPMRTRLSRRL